MEHKETNAFDVLLQVVEVCGRSLEQTRIDVSAEIKHQIKVGIEKIDVIINNNTLNEMSDNINITNSQVGAVGSHATAHDNTFNQTNALPMELDFDKLLKELEALRSALALKATQPDQFTEIAEVSRAEQAAKEKDGNKLLGHLKSAGKWAFDVATEIGAHLVAEILKVQLGIH